MNPGSAPATTGVNIRGGLAVTNASVHLCTDRSWTYLPALDSTATDWPGGALVSESVRVESIPDFDHDPSRDGSCWVCAYAEALHDGRADPPGLTAEQASAQRVGRALRDPSLLSVARRLVAEAEAERRASLPEPPRYREATDAEVYREEALRSVARQTTEAVVAGVSFDRAVQEIVSAARNAPVADEREVPPEVALDLAKKRRGGKKDPPAGQGRLF